MSTPAVASYEEALAFVFNRINYERQAIDKQAERSFKLDRMQQLLSLLGDPHVRIPSVHIAGTKGKGSTAAMTAEILQEAGYRTGLFTSPHVHAFEERIRIDGRSPDQVEFVALVNRVVPVVDRMDRSAEHMQPTYFEIATALAWLHFIENDVEIAVLEVGLGGRLDATNLCRPLATAITSISYDHMAVLGDTLAKIAVEKAGIAKAGVPLISGATDDEAREAIARVCRDRGAPLHEIGDDIQFRATRPAAPHHAWEAGEVFRTGLLRVETPWRTWDSVPLVMPGEHQVANAAVAMGLLGVLSQHGWKISDAAVKAGMSRVKCPLRIEVISRRPTVILDAAHNTASVAALVRTLNESISARRRILIFAASQDKDVRGLLSCVLPEFDEVILTQYQNNPRAVRVDELAHIAHSLGHRESHSAPDPLAAYRLAASIATDDDLICVTGSFFVSAELREYLVETKPALSPAR